VAVDPSIQTGRPIYLTCENVNSMAITIPKIFTNLCAVRRNSRTLVVLGSDNKFIICTRVIVRYMHFFYFKNLHYGSGCTDLDLAQS
jgi:hypothetical protein